MNRHILIMIFCCSIPLGLIFLLPYLSLKISSGALIFFAMLLSPLVHFLLMGKIGHDDESHLQESDESRKLSV